jgi:Asp-tRNA(Asn)/Glu-tRNA(Gln) amidotransferase A subunit family amidase
MATVSVTELTATDLRESLVSGETQIEPFLDQHWEFVADLDAQVNAFCSLDKEVVEAQASDLLAQRSQPQPLGALYGVPVGVKDIIDTVDYPTSYGSPIYDGRYPVVDATLVRRLKHAGAVIFGKTVTTEFATFVPGPTRNPHNLEHTPGGSSSGSAAAVAAGMVPVAIGSQTNGSVIRPASYCGVYGFKPSFGVIPRTGMLAQSPSLDQVGVFARSIEDLALVAQVISGDDGIDTGCRRRSPQKLLDICRSDPPLEPKFCFVKTPWWSKVDPEAQRAYEALVDSNDSIVWAELPAVVEDAVRWHGSINEAELLFSLQRELRQHPEGISSALRTRLEQAKSVSVTDYLLAKDRMPHVLSAFDEFFDYFDAILAPAALGTAPHSLNSTGDPIMQTVWSMAHLPCLNLPLFRLDNGLPLGVQAIGKAYDDARLLRSARWLVNSIATES